MAKERINPHYSLRPQLALRRLLQAAHHPRHTIREITLPWGRALRVDTEEDIGKAVWRLGVCDLAVSEALWRLVDPGDLVIDAGAHIGYMTGIMALRSGETEKVLAFEPHPELYEDLLHNLTLYHLDERLAAIEPHRLALSEVIGESYLETGEDFGRNRGVARLTTRGDSAIRIGTTTVDHVLRGASAGLLKIEVEGLERKVLAGARDSLAGGRIRTIVYEAYAAEGRALATDLEGFGYTVFSLGHDLFGLRLGPAGEVPRVPPYDAPSYVAALQSDDVVRRCAARGWRVLRPPSRERRS